MGKMKKLLVNSLLLLLASPLWSQHLPSWVPKSGLAAFWTMTGNGLDASGNGNHGVVHGATLVTDRFGMENSAYSFNGNGNYIDVKDTASLNPTAALTLSMWVQTTTDHGVAGVLGKWNNYGGIVGISREQFCFDVSDTHYGVNFQVKTTDNYKVSPREDQMIYKNGQWNHYVGTYDGSNARLYVNGKLVSTYRTSGPIPVIKQNFEIGRIAGGQPTCATAFYFTGSIDDVGLWNRALTPAEVSALYSGCPGVEATLSPLGPLSFCQGGSVILKTNAIPGASVFWFRNDTLIAGANDTLYTATRSGQYHVVQTKEQCSSTTPPLTVVVQAPPVASISASGDLDLCQGESVVLTGGGGSTYHWNTGASSRSITVSRAGEYSVQVNAGACGAEASVTVKVNPLPVVAITAPDPFLEYRQAPVTLTAQPAGGQFSGNGVSNGRFDPARAGLGKSTLFYNYTSPEGCQASASQNVIVFDTTGVVCTSFDTLRVVVMDTIIVTTFDTLRVTLTDTLVLTSNRIIPDTLVVTSRLTSNGSLVTRDLLKIYPNPAKTHLNIRFTDYALQKRYSLTIKNSLGQSLFVSDFQGENQSIPVDTWSQGVYLVYLQDEKGISIEIRKVIIQ